MIDENEHEKGLEIVAREVFDLDPHKLLANVSSRANLYDGELALFPMSEHDEMPELPFNPYEIVTNLDYLAGRVMDAEVYVEAAEAVGGDDSGKYLFQNGKVKLKGKFKGFYFIPQIPYEVNGGLDRTRPSMAYVLELGSERSYSDNPAKTHVTYTHAFFPLRSSKLHLTDIGFSANYDLVDESDSFVHVVDEILEDENEPVEGVLRRLGEDVDLLVQMADPPKQHAYLALLNGANILPENTLILPERVFVLENKKLSEIPADIMPTETLFFDLGALPELPEEELREHSPVGQKLALTALFGEDIKVVVPLNQDFIVESYEEYTESSEPAQS